MLVTVATDHVPYVKAADRARFEGLGKGFFRVGIHAGFMERPDVPRLLAGIGLPVDLEDATYFLGRETFVVGKGGSPLRRLVRASVAQLA